MPHTTRAAFDAALAAVRAAEAALTTAIEIQADDDPWLDMADAAKVAPVAKSTLERWAREGRLRAVTGERGKLIVRRSWVDAALLAAPYTPREAELADDCDELTGTGLRVVGRGR